LACKYFGRFSQSDARCAIGELLAREYYSASVVFRLFQGFNQAKVIYYWTKNESSILQTN
jgi:hypothetical protein